MPRHCTGVGKRSQYPGDGLDVTVGVAAQSAPRRGVQIGGLDDNEAKPVCRDELASGTQPSSGQAVTPGRGR